MGAITLAEPRQATRGRPSAYGERSNNIVHWSEFDRGGHFAAMEVPGLLAGDMRKFFRKFRKFR